MLLMKRGDRVDEECPCYQCVLGNEITSASLSLNDIKRILGPLLFQNSTTSCDLENLKNKIVFVSHALLFLKKTHHRT